MVQFSIHFLFCNILISFMIAAILLAKKALQKHLSSNGQYHIWFLLPFVLAVPFLSLRPAGLPRLMHWLCSIQVGRSQDAHAIALTTTADLPSTMDWLNDFGIYVTRDAAPAAACIPFIVWVAGMTVLTTRMIRAQIRLYRIEQSALPLQNPTTRALYQDCIAQLQIQRAIPIYSTAFLKSPIMVGLFRPRIYLPIHLISDFGENDLRYILLHELQHYKHKDAIASCLMNIATVLYWFNPVVWYAVREMRTDREVACDSFVLQMLDTDDYIAYGNTLLNFAQKISLCPFSPAAGIGGNAKQLKKRILNIATYRPQTRRLKIKERIVLVLLAVLLLEATALMPVPVSDTKAALPKDGLLQMEDLSAFFADYKGCFVLYDTNASTWHLYNEPLALKRFSPDSTYKIYSALFALENHVIHPDASLLKWDGQSGPYPVWNQDQTLQSAMQNSVNWYFQELDQSADWNSLKDFYHMIDYGNRDLSGGKEDFWLESSLKISALEQVELLRKLYENEFHFAPQNVQAVKDSLLLASSGQSALYGKTGTGIVNGEHVNGWFVGYAESDGNTWFFATNIQGTDHADSLTAAKITRNILAAKHIYDESGK